MLQYYKIIFNAEVQLKDDMIVDWEKLEANTSNIGRKWRLTMFYLVKSKFRYEQMSDLTL